MTTLEQLRRIGGHPALDFANTIDPDVGKSGTDYIKTYRDLVEWSRLEGLIDSEAEQVLIAKATSSPRRAASEYRRALQVRKLLTRIFSDLSREKKPRGADLAELSRLSGAARALQAICEKHGRFYWEWRPPLELSMPIHALADAGANLLTKVRDKERSRIRSCAGTTCRWIFLDTSKAGTRRWCSMEACGNRAKARSQKT